MLIRRHDSGYNFFGDTSSGVTMRWGNKLEENPYMAPWPELVDISISNYCTKGCNFCYRDSDKNGENISLEDYEFILDNLNSKTWGNVFQVALGGGEPLEHPYFIEILKMTTDKGIVPNFTTNGEHVSKELAIKIKPFVGAVAISAISIKTFPINAAHILSKEGIKTNLHFVLSEESMDEGIALLEGKYNSYLTGINAVIFLTYKPKGRAVREKCIKNDERLKYFLSMVSNNHCSARVGFDACMVPALLYNTACNPDFVDSCECGFFSIYIDEKMNVKPCSFTNDNQYTFNLKEYSFENIWNQKLKHYRELLAERHTCEAECENKNNCRGNCIYFSDIAFCGSN